MANPTYTLISTQTVGAGGAASVTFSSIPQTFTDLKLVASVRDTVNDTNGALFVAFNSVAANYSYRNVYGAPNIPTVASGSASSQSKLLVGYTDSAGQTANTFSSHDIYIPNYTGSTAKSVSTDSVEENNGSLGYSQLWAGLSADTAAIATVTLTPATAFAQYSTFSLYGIKNS